MSKLLLPHGYNNAELLDERLKRERETDWVRRGEKRAIGLFHEMSERVPAYKDFLKSHNFDPRSVVTIEDFQKIPVINKENYLRKYPREMLCWDGEFAQKRWVISSTSGSTGQPFYFPRDDSEDQQYAITAELYLRNNFSIQSKSTLYIDAFAMGAWIGGVFTYEAIKTVAERGYRLSIITPGTHKHEVVSAVKQLGKDFDQVIIGAYAPFLKDILDDGVRQGVNWSEYNLGFVFSAEGFSEKFRDYVFKTTGIQDKLSSTLNHYGTVDLGTMAHETPESIMIRRILAQEQKLTLLFPETNRQPTFAQYNPELFYFEAVEDTMLCSAYSGIPLVRYDLKDYGGVLSRSEVHERLRSVGLDVTAAARKENIENKLWNLPFVYVYERNDFSVNYYAFIVYPDTIRRALQRDELAEQITGKFSMQADYDDSGRQKLHVNIELKPGQASTPQLAEQIGQHIHDDLMYENSEYQVIYGAMGSIIVPIVHLWDYEDPNYFRPGAKQRWVIKS